MSDGYASDWNDPRDKRIAELEAVLREIGCLDLDDGPPCPKVRQRVGWCNVCRVLADE
jgi:hypothetical protein